MSEYDICADICLYDERKGFEGDAADVTMVSTTYITQTMEASFESLLNAHDMSIPLFAYYAANLVHEPVEVGKLL